MIRLFHFFKGILNFILNILFVIQITLMILVFFTASYWFFDLAGIGIFNFAEPLANAISEFVKLFYTREIMIGDLYIDGSLLLFDIVSLIIVFVITKSKFYINQLIYYIDLGVRNCKNKEEELFNQELAKENSERLNTMDNFVFMVELEITDRIANRYRGANAPVRDPKVTEDIAFKLLYTAMKNLSCCSFAKNENRLLIFIKNSEFFDNTLYFIEQAILKIKAKLAQEDWILNSYVVADAYCSSDPFQTKVLPVLNDLIKFKGKNKILCFGNVKHRYEIQEKQMYKIILYSGAYELAEGTDIYEIVKII